MDYSSGLLVTANLSFL